MKWGDISIIPTDKPEDKKIRRAVSIAAENSKTGKSRTIVAPIANTLESLQKLYKSIELNADQMIMCSSTSKTKEDRILFGGNLLLINALNLFAL